MFPSLLNGYQILHLISTDLYNKNYLNFKEQDMSSYNVGLHFTLNIRATKHNALYVKNNRDVLAKLL